MFDSGNLIRFGSYPPGRIVCRWWGIASIRCGAAGWLDIEHGRGFRPFTVNSLAAFGKQPVIAAIIIGKLNRLQMTTEEGRAGNGIERDRLCRDETEALV